MVRYHKALLIILTGLLLFSPLSQGTLFAATDYVPTPFTDLPSDPMYYPAIEIFQNQNIIIGDTAGGSPTAKLRPTDYLQRDEFTKVAVIVRLLEEGNTHLLNLGLNPFTLSLNAILQPYYKVTPANGAIAFLDIKEKDKHCAVEPSGCSPWHTEYINYASSQRMIKGYTEDNTFRPKNSILKVHGLKLAIASDGSLPSAQDPKVTRLSNDTRIQNRTPRCLAGAEEYILQNNGGNTQDSQNLLAYALLADKLDIFGNRCQAFTDAGIKMYDKQAIADYLQTPIRRQEIARYFALTTTILELKLDPATDSTVDTRNEYIMPISDEIKEEKNPLEGKVGFANDSSGSKTTTVNTPSEPEDEEETIAEYFRTEGIEECGYISADRVNSRERILDCIMILKRSGKSDEEINRLLKKYGLWDKVKDMRESVVVGTEMVVSAGDYWVNLGQNYLEKQVEDYKFQVIEVARSMAELWANLDNELVRVLNLEKTRDWGLKGKTSGTTEYRYVLMWHEDRKERRIEGTYYAPKDVYRMKLRPNMDIGPSIWKMVPDTEYVPFKIVKKGQFNSYIPDPDRNTYIVSHGWVPLWADPGSDNWTPDMANAILARDPRAQILLIDWGEIAHKLTPGMATKWLDAVTRVTTDVLMKWGINKDRTFVVGNSLGSILSQELSTKLGDVHVIGLDPAFSALGYEVDFENTEFTEFNDSTSACFVADASWSGSEALMRSCREGYLIDYSGTEGFSLISEVHQYVDFVIDEAIGDTIKTVIDEGITYAIDKATKTRSGTTIPGVKLYRIINGELKEVVVEDIKKWACKVVNTGIPLPYICKYATQEIINFVKNRFVTYHLNVPETYGSIMRYPFYGGKLTAADIASRKGGYAPFNKMELSKLLNKTTHGIIYTEKDAPDLIKYLKVQTYASPDKYTLYGNTQKNRFECEKKRNKECILYTSTGNDEIMQGTLSKNIDIMDFMEDNDKDTLFLERSGINLQLIDIKISQGAGGVELTLEYGKPIGGEWMVMEKRTINLPGHGYGEVNGWVRTAKDPITYPADEGTENPIILK